MLKSGIAHSKILLKMWSAKHVYFRTALKYRKRFKEMSKHHVRGKEGYYTIHRSKSGLRKFVTGGPKLKSSGVYTVKFCEATIELWRVAAGMERKSFANPGSTGTPLHQLWRQVFQAGSIEKDMGVPSTPVVLLLLVRGSLPQCFKKLLLG